MTAGDVTRYNSRCAAGHGGVAYVAAEIITKLVQKSTGTAAWARGENDMLGNLQPPGRRRDHHPVFLSLISFSCPQENITASCRAAAPQWYSGLVIAQELAGDSRRPDATRWQDPSEARGGLRRLVCGEPGAAQILPPPGAGWWRREVADVWRSGGIRRGVWGFRGGRAAGGGDPGGGAAVEESGEWARCAGKMAATARGSGPGPGRGEARRPLGGRGGARRWGWLRLGIEEGGERWGTWVIFSFGLFLFCFAAGRGVLES
nr:uncharacterized protein LOC109778868 [Aegilops tauschii subsp. strangulata]